MEIINNLPEHLKPLVRQYITGFKCLKKNENGFFIKSYITSEGKKHGVEKCWYANGILYYEKNWDKGKKHGVEKWWYGYFAPGKLRLEKNWDQGKKHGTDKRWYENGQLHYEINWNQGKKHGIEKCWNEDGQKNYKTNWDQGTFTSQMPLAFLT